MKVNYKTVIEELYAALGSAKKMVLATSSQNRTTARTMSCIVLGGKIVFQTDRDFLKIKQILENPRVALCVDNIQIEGVATVIGHPFEEMNHSFLDRFKTAYEGSYRMYSHLPSEIVVEVDIAHATRWKYEAGKPFRLFIDYIQQNATKEYYAS